MDNKVESIKQEGSSYLDSLKNLWKSVKGAGEATKNFQDDFWSDFKQGSDQVR